MKRLMFLLFFIFTSNAFSLKQGQEQIIAAINSQTVSDYCSNNFNDFGALEESKESSQFNKCISLTSTCYHDVYNDISYSYDELADDTVRIISDEKSKQCITTKFPKDSTNQPQNSDPQEQQALNLCQVNHTKAVQECGDEKQSSLKSGIGQAMNILGGVGSNIYGVCNTSVQTFSGAYSLIGTFTNSCGSAARDCLSSCQAASYTYNDAIRQDANNKLKTCQGYQNKVAELMTDYQRLGNSINQAASCAQNSGTKFDFASLDCSGVAASSPNCICKKSPDPQGCLTQYLSQQGTTSLASKPGFTPPKGTATNDLKENKASGIPPYSEEANQFNGVGEVKPSAGDNQPGRPGGGTIGSPNGGGGLTGGGGDPGGGGGYGPDSSGGVALNKGFMPAGTSTGSSWRPNGSFSPSPTNSKSLYPNNLSNGQMPNFDKYKPSLAIERKSASTGLELADGVQPEYEKIFKIMQKGYRESDKKDYFFNK